MVIKSILEQLRGYSHILLILSKKCKSYTRIFFLTVLFIPLQIFPKKRSSLQNVTGQIMLLAIRVVYDKLLLFNYDNYLL